MVRACQQMMPMTTEPVSQAFRPTLRCSGNAPLCRGFVFRTPGCARLPVFLASPIGEGWSAGRRPGGVRDPLSRACETRLHAKLPGPKGLEGGGGPGARGPLRGARAPLGAPSRHALSAAAPCFVSGVAIDDAFN